MGHTHHTMALAMFDTTFPRMGRRMGPRMGFADFDRTFADMEARRQDFMNQMEVDGAVDGAQCYSSYSSTFRSGDNAPVTHSQESYRVAGGTTVSRSIRRVGDKMVEETIRDGETHRTLQNLSEDELAQFEAQHQAAQHPRWLEAPQAPPASPQAALPAALESDLQRLKQ